MCLFRALVVGLSKYINPPLYKPPFHKVTLHLPALDLAILGILYITIQCFSIDECLTFNRTSKFILFYCNTVLVTQVWNTNTAKLPSFLYCKCLPYTSNPQTLKTLRHVCSVHMRGIHCNFKKGWLIFFVFINGH